MKAREEHLVTVDDEALEEVSEETREDDMELTEMLKLYLRNILDRT